MKLTAFRALTNYETPALALVGKPTNGQYWLLNDQKIYQDGTMPKSGPASVKNPSQKQLATATLNPTIQRNKASVAGVAGANKAAGYANTSKGAGTFVNRETISNPKTAFTRHKIMYYVTDSNAPGGYRPVFDILQADNSVTDTNAYRDDDNQVRK